MHLMSVQLKMKKHSSYVGVHFISSVFTVYHRASLINIRSFISEQTHKGDWWITAAADVHYFVRSPCRTSSSSGLVFNCPHFEEFNGIMRLQYGNGHPRARVHGPLASSLMGNEWRLFISSCSSSTGGPPTDREDDRWRIECAVYFLLSLSWLPNIFSFHLFVKRWCHKFLCTARSFPSKCEDKCCVGCSHCLSSPINPHRFCGC